jgi:hypothetical protein
MGLFGTTNNNTINGNRGGFGNGIVDPYTQLVRPQLDQQQQNQQFGTDISSLTNQTNQLIAPVKQLDQNARSEGQYFNPQVPSSPNQQVPLPPTQQ